MRFAPIVSCLCLCLALAAPAGAAPMLSLEVNLPAFSVRLLADGYVEREWRCRIGKRETRTLTGDGIVSRVFKPAYFRYDKGEKAGEVIVKSTVRRYVGGPELRVIDIPYAERMRGLELELDGRVSGQIIHSTTNPETIGHVTSNGCVGMYEADMLELFDLAGAGTPVRVVYRLVEYDGRNLLFYRDVYDTGNDMADELHRILAAIGIELTPPMERRLLLEGMRTGSVDLAAHLARVVAEAGE